MEQETLLTTPKELLEAAKRAEPGAVLVLNDGIWRDAELTLVARGTASKPITLRAQTPGRVVLTGSSRLRFSGEHLVISGLWFKGGSIDSGEVISFRTKSDALAHHCRLTQCAITGVNPPDKKRDTKWVSLHGTHNRVDHCYFAGKTNLGTTLVVWLAGNPNDHHIDHNHFGPRPELGTNGGETIRVGTSDRSLSVSRTTVEENLFERCDGETEIISNKSCENLYRKNTFLECAGTLTLRHGNRCKVTGNVFLGNQKPQTGGIRVIGEDHEVRDNYLEGLTGRGGYGTLCFMNGIPNSPLKGYWQVKRARLIGNTVIDCACGVVIGQTGANGTATLPPLDCVVEGTTFWKLRGPQRDELTPPLNLRWSKNTEREPKRRKGLAKTDVGPDWRDLLK